MPFMRAASPSVSQRFDRMGDRNPSAGVRHTENSSDAGTTENPLYHYLVRCPWACSQYILRKMVSVLRKPVYMTFPSTAHRVRVPSKRSRHHHRHQSTRNQQGLFSRGAAGSASTSSSHSFSSSSSVSIGQADFRVYDESDSSEAAEVSIRRSYDGDDYFDDDVTSSDDEFDESTTDDSSMSSAASAGVVNGGAGAGAPPVYKIKTVSHNFVDLHLTRQTGLNRYESYKVEPHFATEYLVGHNLLKEHCIRLRHDLDKIFTAQWLNERQIVFGTKCNKLMVYSTTTRQCEEVPTLERPQTSRSRKRKKVPLVDSTMATSSATDPLYYVHDENLSEALFAGDGSSGPFRSALYPYPNEFAILDLPPADANQGGIHAVRINKSGTLLVTGARQSTEVAVYALPGFDPVLIGGDAHQDLIFDLAWISDQVFVSGSRDNTLAAWRVSSKDLDRVTARSQKTPPPSTNSEDENEEDEEGDEDGGRVTKKKCRRSAPIVPKHRLRSPFHHRKCLLGDKVRTLGFNSKFPELVAISMNAYIHVFEPESFRQKYSRRLPHAIENVCLAINEAGTLYAIGSKSHVTLMDARTLTPTEAVRSPVYGCGIRSLSFQNNFVTMGTGMGHICFYDVRNHKYVESVIQPGQTVELQMSRGAMMPGSGENLYDTVVYPAPADAALQPGNGLSIESPPAVYTHCFDETGTRLFAGGGPLQVGVQGSYASIWQ